MALIEALQTEGGFRLPVSFSLVAYFTGGLTGALAGVKRGYDVIGVLAMATLAAGGGSLIRDGVLISSGPTALLTDARYLEVVLASALVTLVFHRQVQRLAKTIAIIDALGLGAFAVYGVEVSLRGHLSVPGAILGGTVTAVGGGVMRDILVREEALLLKPGQFYALAAIGASGLFLALVRWTALTPNEAALLTIGLTFTFRMLTIRFNWRTSAIYREPKDPSS